jgi:hypothetical protein
LRAAIFVDRQPVAWADSHLKAVSTDEKSVLTAKMTTPHQSAPVQ